MPLACFMTFIPNETVRLIGAEAAGHGVDTALHAATMAKRLQRNFPWYEIFIPPK